MAEPGVVYALVANAAVEAFPAAPEPISAFVPAKGWSLSLPQNLVADIMERAVREMLVGFGISAAARTVARLSRACPDFYAAAPAGWAAVAEGYDGNDGDVPSSMLVHPHSHSLPALRAACAAAGVPATTTLSKAQAILALLGAHGLAAPLRAPVPSGLIRRVREEPWRGLELALADHARQLRILELALADASMSASRLLDNARQVQWELEAAAARRAAALEAAAARAAAAREAAAREAAAREAAARAAAARRAAAAARAAAARRAAAAARAVAAARAAAAAREAVAAAPSLSLRGLSALRRAHHRWRWQTRSSQALGVVDWVGF